MPFNRKSESARWTRLLAVALDRLAAEVGLLAGYAALGVAILSGEWLAASPELRSLLHIAVPRTLHLLAGLVLALFMVARLVGGLKVLRGRVTARRGESPEGVPAGFEPSPWLSALWWGVLWVIALTGLERYLLLSRGTGMLPQPSGFWWALHGALRPFLYALLLWLAVKNGKIWVKKALQYLRTP